MADLVIPPAEVTTPTGVTPVTASAGAVINAGEALYIDSNGLAQLASAAAQDTAKCNGIAVNSALKAGQAVSYVATGDMFLGVATVPAAVYCLSANAGKIAPVADLSAGQYRTNLGVGATAAQTLRIGIAVTDVPA